MEMPWVVHGFDGRLSHHVFSLFSLVRTKSVPLLPRVNRKVPSLERYVTSNQAWKTALGQGDDILGCHTFVSSPKSRKGTG